jgi:PKD repeat protein
MRGIVIRGAIGIVLAGLAVLSACTSSMDNGLDAIPQVHITESARTALTAGAVGTAITVTDDSSGASVTIPAGTVFSLDASSSDDVPAVVPDSIVVVLRPISQFLAAQDGDLLTADGLNLPDLQKVGALAVLPAIGRTDSPFTITVPVVSTATGELSIYHFEPDDNPNSDGVLTALPNVGHWRFVDAATAAGGKVTFTTDTFGQYLITSLTDTGGGGTAPTVELAADKTSGDAPLTVVFSATPDDDGTITKYEWDFDGDGDFDTNTTEGTATTTYDADGQFNAKVQVTDNDGETGIDTLTINVGNVPPTVTSLDPLTATTGVDQEFTVTATDSDGTIAKYEWDLDNDATFELDTEDVASTTTSFATAGTHMIGVRVIDNEGAVSDPQTFDIVVSDATGPTATLLADPETGVLSDTNQLPVTFTTTLDPDTTEGTVVYDFGDESEPVTETDTPLTADHIYTAPGTFTATVTVTPTGGGDDIVATTVVRVLPVGTVIAELAADPGEGTLSSGTLSVDFTTTLTPDTTQVDSAVYDFGDESEPAAETDETPLTATHVYTAAGTYNVTVTITPTGGGDNMVGTTTVIVNAESGGANQAPTAVISQVVVEGNPRAFNLDASGSTDPENDALTFAWEWDSTHDGPEAETESATATFPESADGTPQTITLTVTDTAANTDTDEALVVPTAPAA